MTDFKHTNNIICARLLLKNPALAGKWFTINVKAYKANPLDPLLGDDISVIGHQYVGYWRFPNIFKT
jgi:hypothetical protein